MSKIVSIPYLAQAMMAITLLKPDSARARPSTLINSELEYKKLFSLDIPIDVYLKVIQIMKSVENYLKPEKCGQDLPRKDITDIKFYVAMLVGIKVCGVKKGIIGSLAVVPKIEVNDSLLKDSFNQAMDKYKELGGTDKIAKGSDLVQALLVQ